MSALLGVAFGLLPCPSALAAYFASMSSGSPVKFACELSTADSGTAKIGVTRSLAANAKNVSRYFSMIAALKTKQPSERNLRAEHYWWRPQESPNMKKI